MLNTPPDLVPETSSPSDVETESGAGWGIANCEKEDQELAELPCAVLQAATGEGLGWVMERIAPKKEGHLGCLLLFPCFSDLAAVQSVTVQDRCRLGAQMP